MEQNKEARTLKQKIYDFYDKKYKVLLIIPFLILLLSLAQIGWQIHSTGDFIKKDVSLKGGVTVTVPYTEAVDVESVQSAVSGIMHEEISVRRLGGSGQSLGLIVEAPIDGTDNAKMDELLSSIEKASGINLDNYNLGIEIIGSSLGSSFFRESLVALLIAFVLMALVILLYFRTIVPSMAVILAAFSDMVFALACINLMGVQVGTAGIAAFLMLIGYSVDTDILLTVRVLKRKEGTIMERVMSSMKTGITMTIAAIVSTVVALLVSHSEVIRQIMLILLLGLIADIIMTWIQNVGILRLYAERKAKKGVHI